VKTTAHAQKFYASFLYIEYWRLFREKKNVTKEKMCFFVRIGMIGVYGFSGKFSLF